MLAARPRGRSARFVCHGCQSRGGHTRLRPGIAIRARQEVAVTHLPHIFVAVVPEVQLVGCYDFVASAVVVVWICAENSQQINK